MGLDKLYVYEILLLFRIEIRRKTYHTVCCAYVYKQYVLATRKSDPKRNLYTMYAFLPAVISLDIFLLMMLYVIPFDQHW